ncbi:hypothetical protein [Aliiglaciecola sp. LCG003]|uniref:LPS translocon maturation chaperone LptM n=1 Tax=Aliiglaciecola sp. LCG003 TaxID=3053655 RepID=UPI002573C0CD|nr:hypothetical protein [Aliiglaciecola sp. LCG003]WJG09664.1 hypothetical protein QR722_01100 [Aliiglaciecola sp. LCG003]
MKKLKRIQFKVLTLIVSFVLGGCGVSGELYLPEQQNTQPVEQATPSNPLEEQS